MTRSEGSSPAPTLLRGTAVTTQAPSTLSSAYRKPSPQACAARRSPGSCPASTTPGHRTPALLADLVEQRDRLDTAERDTRRSKEDLDEIIRALTDWDQQECSRSRRPRPRVSASPPASQYISAPAPALSPSTPGSPGVGPLPGYDDSHDRDEDARMGGHDLQQLAPRATPEQDHTHAALPH